MLVKRFGINQHGRDFVCGDIHGAFDLVVQGLKKVRFDTGVDRLFCPGDLIDRGDDSYRCAEFLAQPYVHCCAGNHEDMLIEMFHNGEPDEAIIDWMERCNGFKWWRKTPKETQDRILNAVRNLPLVIEIETVRGTVGIVHAEVPKGMNWQTFVAKIEAGDPAVRQIALWGGRESGNSRIDVKDTSGVEGIGRIFVGHNIQWGGLQKLGNIYAIDTGAVFGQYGKKEEGKLTMADILCRTTILEAASEQTCLVDLRCNWGTAPSPLPFGPYASADQSKSMCQP